MRRSIPAALLAACTMAVLGLLAAAPASAGGTTTYRIWFERSSHVWLSKRTQPLTTAPATAALRAMLAGPRTAEQAAGVTTAVPAGTTLRSLAVRDGVATADLSGEFAAWGTARSVRMRLAQVTLTLTQYSTIRSVRLLVNGGAVSSVGGVRVSQPFTRAQFTDLFPAILVATPSIGDYAAGAVSVSGNADVFERRLTARVVNENGVTLARWTGLASCNNGCRGGFWAGLRFTVARTQLGAVILADSDTDGDGMPQHQVRVPIVLAPTA
jgi:hypothetical protein